MKIVSHDSFRVWENLFSSESCVFHFCLCLSFTLGKNWELLLCFSYLLCSGGLIIKMKGYLLQCFY